jgi:hypothetical protein
MTGPSSFGVATTCKGSMTRFHASDGRQYLADSSMSLSMTIQPKRPVICIVHQITGLKSTAEPLAPISRSFYEREASSSLLQSAVGDKPCVAMSARNDENNLGTARGLELHLCRTAKRDSAVARQKKEAVSVPSSLLIQHVDLWYEESSNIDSTCLLWKCISRVVLRRSVVTNSRILPRGTFRHPRAGRTTIRPL